MTGLPIPIQFEMFRTFLRSGNYNRAKTVIEDIATYVDDKTGNTALHELSEIETKDENVVNNFAIMMKELFDNGADPNIQNKEGKTPLLLSSKNSNYVLSKLLLENRANPNIRGSL